MLLVTTLDYNQFGAFIRDKQVSLDNADLIFGSNFDAIKRYIMDRLGSDSYVMGIRGRINQASVGLLEQLDSGLHGDKVIMEVDVDDDDVLCFDAIGLEDAAQILTYGLPDEILYDQLDQSIVRGDTSEGISVVCTPVVKRGSGVRLTCLNRDISVDADDITFIQLRDLKGR